MSKQQLYTVLAVRCDDGTKARLMQAGLTLTSAEGYSEMAAMRRGCDVEYYPVVTDEEAKKRLAEVKP